MALFDTIRAGSSAASDYLIPRSLRFDSGSSTYLRRTSVSSVTNQSKWTMSLWIKRTCIPNGHDMEMLFGNDYYTGSISTRGFQFAVNHSSGINDMRIQTFDGASSMGMNNSAGQYRDPHAWMHILVQYDASQGTQSNRMIVRVNGEDIGLGNSISQNQALTWNKPSRVQYLGCHDVNGGQTRFFNGYIAEANFIDGQYLDHTNFTETDADTGELKPIKYSGTYGNNGWYCNFGDNSNTTASTLGKDSSGNGNNFTPNNFSVSSGNGNDSVEDTPTNNWCTLSPYLRKTRSNASFSNGNMKVITGSGAGSIGCSMGVSTGKWYAEFKCTAKSSVHFMIGVATINGFDGERQTNESQADGFGLAYLGGSSSPAGNKMTDGGGSSSYGASYNTGDIIGVALDLDNNTVNFAKNNVYQGSLSISTTKGDVINKFFTFSIGGGQGGTNQTFEANFGASGFTYTPPTGFLAVNTKNLTESTIKNGKKFMNTVIYQGNGSNRNITGFGFDPDWIWVKKRSGGSDRSHQVFDVLRGAQQTMHMDGTDSSHSTGNRLSAFISDGFSIGTSGGDDGINGNGNQYVAWGWEAGSSNVTNSSGSISATVRASASSGFSIVQYSGNGSSGATVGHGLGVKPSSIIIKCTNANDHWMTYHQQLNNGSSPENRYLELNESGAQINDSRMMNNTAPTSTVFSLRNDGSTNSSGRNYIAYCFAEIPGYNKFGMYRGTGGTENNTLVFCGFRPQWIMVKKITGGENWQQRDTVRETTNVTTLRLQPNNNTNEGQTNGDRIDIYSCGFKPRDGAGQFGENNSTYVYWAFAENPFKIARAR